MKAEDARLLAILVHQKVLPEPLARAAMQSGDPRRWLIEQGHATAEGWNRWVATAGGTRPVLTRYDVGELLGEGGVARVFRARDRLDGRVVALKVLRPEFERDARQVERFLAEARLLMDLQHPHLVRGQRVAREGSTIFLAEELVEGECLQDLIGKRGRMDEESALEVVAQVASALQLLHSRGLVHRDVKPANILWSEARGAVLIDLGFAVSAAQSAGGDTTAGTAHYIAPEQARGQGGLDVRADIYALGATLYHLVTGSLPFEGSSSEEVVARQVLESLSGERIRALGLAPQTHYFIEKMMAKEREIRFQDPATLEREIRAWLQQKQMERQFAEHARRDSDRGRRTQRRRFLH